MTTLPDDALLELWTLYDQSGIRPEWVLPMLYLESGFDPTLQNRAGAPYYGLAQDFGPYLARHNITPAEYVAMPASGQLAAIVVPRLAGLVKAWGPLRSATRVYQANFQPASLKTARSLSSVIVWRGHPDYAANTILDVFKDGAITVSDLAWWMADRAAQPEARAALARAYALRPTEKPANTVYGGDFLDPLWWLLAPAAGAGYALP
jgi:hypothetical protein